MEESVFQRIEPGSLGMDFSGSTYIYPEYTDYIQFRDDTENFDRIIPRSTFISANSSLALLFWKSHDP